MPFVIQTLKGKEKIVQAVLRKQGVDSRVSPIREFVICDEQPPLHIKELPQVLEVVEATPEQVDYLLNDTPPDGDEIKEGTLVEVIAGSYEGFNGLVREIIDEKATVDLNIFGRMLPVELAFEDIRKVELSNQWI